MTEEVSEEEIKQLEEELKKLEDKDTGYGAPSAVQKDSTIKFFRDVLTQEDTTRISNLTAVEIGESRLSMRGCKHIAKYCHAEGLDIIGNYFEDMSNIISEPAMSKKGFFLQTVVTQIKKESKVKDTSEKKKWFNKESKGGE